MKFPRLSIDLPGSKDGKSCQKCGTRVVLGRWEECDDDDKSEGIFVTLCSSCSQQIIGPHARLYRRADAGSSKPVLSAAVLTPPRYAEEIKGYFNCEDGADFLVIARKGQGFISHGAIYVFVQDRARHVWQITGFSSSGFFKKKLVLDLVSQGGDRRKITIDSIREPQRDQVAKCIAMAAMMARTGVPVFSTALQWKPYDPEDADGAWSMIR